jgi:hypothetical protein
LNADRTDFTFGLTGVELLYLSTHQVYSCQHNQ